MSVTERIAEIISKDKALSVWIDVLKAESARQKEEQDNRKQTNISLFEKFLQETGLGSIFEEVIEGQELGSAEINIAVNQEGNLVSLEMRWPQIRKPSYSSEELCLNVISSPEPGFNKISLGVDYTTDTFFVNGALQKCSTSLNKLNLKEIEFAVARAYLDPEWESGIKVVLPAETVK